MNKQELAEFYKGKKILITGHTGFKGSWLAKVLLGFGAKIIGYSREPPTDPNMFSILKLENKIKHYIGNITDFNKIKKILDDEKPEIVFHMAAQTIVREGYSNPIETYKTNTFGTATILQAIKETGCVKSAVMITTDKVYENTEECKLYKETDALGGHDPYSSSKASAEIIISSYIKSFFNAEDYGKKHNTLVCSVRAGNVVGGGDWAKYRLIPDIIRSFFKDNKELIIRCPESIRPWQYILEPLTGYMILGVKLYNGEKEYVGPWNLGPEESSCIAVESLVKNAIKILEKGSYSIEEDKTKHEACVLKLDATKAKTKLGWNPALSIDETLMWTFEWYKKFYENEDMEEFTEKQIKEFFLRV